MGLKIVKYKSAASLEACLAGLGAPGEKVFFLVPGSPDREELKNILISEGSFGSESFTVTRWDEVYRELSSHLGRPGLIQIDPSDHWLAIRESVNGLIKQFGDRLPPGVSQSGFVRTAGEAVRELIREEISPGALRARLFQDRTDRPGEPAWILSRIYGEYTNLLESRGLADSAGICSRITDLIKSDPRAPEWFAKRRWVLVGFYSFTHSQLEMVRSAVRSGADVTVVCPTAGMKGEYGAPAQLADMAREEESLECSPPVLFTVEAGSARQEFETVIRELVLWEKGLGAMASMGPFPGWGAAAAAVGTESVSLAREVLNRYSVPYDRVQGPAAAQTPLWETARMAWEWMTDGWRADAASELSDLPWMDPSSLDAARDFAAAVARGSDAEGLLRALKDLTSRGRGWQAALSAQVESRPDLDEVVRETGLAIEELDRKLSLARCFRPKLRGAEAMAFLHAWAERAVLWAGFGRRGTLALHVGTPPVLSGRDLWIIFGATAGNWPGSLAESPLLRDEQKELLHFASVPGTRLDHTHLPLLAEKRIRREVLFRRLLMAANKYVVVSWPSMDERGRPLCRTAFLDRALEDRWARGGLGIRRPSGRILPAFDEPVLYPAEVRELPPGLWFKTGRELPGSVPQEGRTVALSHMDDFRNCPFLFRARHLWGLEPPKEPGFDAALAGTALHGIWKEAWQAYSDGWQGSLASLVQEFAKPVLLKTYRALLEDEGLARRRDLFLQSLVRAANTLDLAESAGLRDLRSLSFTEYELPSFNTGGVTFSGRADRIDVLKDGRVIIWDYKSGPSDSYGSSIQLASYGVLLTEAPDSPASPGAGLPNYVFLGHRDGELRGASDPDIYGILGIKGRKPDLKSKIDEARDAMESLARAVKSGEFPPACKSSLCRRCSWAVLCRRGELENPEEDDDEPQ